MKETIDEFFTDFFYAHHPQGGPGGGSAPAVLETVKPDVQIPEVTILPDPRSMYGRALQDPMMLRDRQMMLVG